MHLFLHMHENVVTSGLCRKFNQTKHRSALHSERFYQSVIPIGNCRSSQEEERKKCTQHNKYNTK